MEFPSPPFRNNGGLDNMKNKLISLLCPSAFLIFGVYIITESLKFKSTDGIFPIMTAVLLMSVSLIQLTKDLLVKEHKDRFAGSNLLQVLEYTAALLLYAFLFKKIGYILDTLWMTAYTMFALRYRDWKRLILISFGITAILYLIFRVLLKVPLPTLWL